MGTGEVQILVQDPAAVDYEISHVMVVQVRPTGLAHLGDSSCSLHMLGCSRDTALLLQGSKVKAEHGSALTASLVQGELGWGVTCLFPMLRDPWETLSLLCPADCC